MQTIDYKEFLDCPFDPFVYYEFLPADEVEITGALAGPDTAFLAASLAAGTLDDNIADTADLLTARLLNGDFPAGFAGWEDLADRLARRYATLLSGSSAARPLRMRLQRLTFCIRDLLDRDRPVVFAGERRLTGRNPWDWLDLPGGTFTITCDHDNLCWTPHDGGPGWAIRCGLPSQIDLLDDGTFGVGSSFEPGGWLVRDGQAVFLPHDAPIICLFRDNSELYGLDGNGRIIRVKDGAVPACLPDGIRPSRARYIGAILYAMDWSRPGTLFRIEPATGHVASINTGPVIICNDLCEAGDGFAMVDKEKGNVFLFDAAWCHTATLLAFGRGAGRLCDPIAVKATNQRVEALNWFNGKIVTVNLNSTFSAAGSGE